ncbi:hypothetical protein [Cuspidothrix issatschenkoi]|uniref:Spore coat protein U domain-containing protein n=1 Tax=Cuspidothrix issatschenkoi CHARLIE-1 TaxID=2052836 RepID=A0A2S6CZQ9_9CYAN|nr:hypothetical protein [Cuspidothrix issatschenkoi]PPJ65248.1 hypothetical protein CUN59_00325 [Cuspidothrix issatschenkoi CHARLIE-1]
MSLRRFFIASSLILSPLGFGSAAFAQTTSNINLTATVPATASITLTPTTEATNLYDSISQSQRGSVKIADFNVTTNTPGVTLTASSINGGNLRNSNGDDIPYKLEITGSGGAAPTNGFSTVTNFSRFMDGDADLYIEIPNIVNSLAGTYSDTLTLTISTSN